MRRETKASKRATHLGGTCLLLLAGLLTAACGFALADGTAPASGATADSPVFVVYYLHGTRRCRTCLSIEATTQRILDDWFREELSSGRMIWKPLNFEEKGNEHFVQDFGLVSSSVVVAQVNNGKPVRYKVLQDVWKLIHDDLRFRAYITREIRDFIGKPL